jgi:hypothetical protein
MPKSDLVQCPKCLSWNRLSERPERSCNVTPGSVNQGATSATWDGVRIIVLFLRSNSRKLAIGYKPNALVISLKGRGWSCNNRVRLLRTPSDLSRMGITMDTSFRVGYKGQQSHYYEKLDCRPQKRFVKLVEQHSHVAS